MSRRHSGTEDLRRPRGRTYSMNFHDAMVSGSMFRVKQGLKNGSLNIDDLNWANRTYLNCAITSESRKEITFLLNNGANICNPEAKPSPIVSLIQHHPLELLKFCLEHNVDINQRAAVEEDGNIVLKEPVVYCLETRRYEQLKLLLAYGGRLPAPKDSTFEHRVSIPGDYMDLLKGYEHWNQQIHPTLSSGFRNTVKTMLLMWTRDEYDEDECNGFEWNMLPWEVLENIIQQLYHFDDIDKGRQYDRRRWEEFEERCEGEQFELLRSRKKRKRKHLSAIEQVEGCNEILKQVEQQDLETELLQGNEKKQRV